MNLLHSNAAPLRARDFGYASRHYAESLKEFGTVRELPRCGGWLLERPIPNSNMSDGMGCYPLFNCQDWCELPNELEKLAERLVCVNLVTDPFADVAFSQLQTIFPDVCYEYKQHFVTDLSLPLDDIVDAHHQRNVRKARSTLAVRQSTGDDDLLQEWLQLYDNLVRRHGINGIARFSPSSFERQMAVPGFMAFSALERNATCGMTLWYVQGDVAYYHLGAYSDRGYESATSFALFWTALTHFASIGVRWAALGAGAGATAAESGLTRFKRGWATHTRPAYFCGRILQPAAYAQLSARNSSKSEFFPAYREA
jgi:hypothetical protein